MAGVSEAIEKKAPDHFSQWPIFEWDEEQKQVKVFSKVCRIMVEKKLEDIGQGKYGYLERLWPSEKRSPGAIVLGVNGATKSVTLGALQESFQNHQEEDDSDKDILKEKDLPKGKESIDDVSMAVRRGRVLLFRFDRRVNEPVLVEPSNWKKLTKDISAGNFTYCETEIGIGEKMLSVIVGACQGNSESLLLEKALHGYGFGEKSGASGTLLFKWNAKAKVPVLVDPTLWRDHMEDLCKGNFICSEIKVGQSKKLVGTVVGMQDGTVCSKEMLAFMFASAVASDCSAKACLLLKVEQKIKQAKFEEAKKAFEQKA